METKGCTCARLVPCKPFAAHNPHAAHYAHSCRARRTGLLIHH